MMANEPNTYHALAQTELGPDGRFAKRAVGPQAIPPQPANSPWACDPVPTEPPLGRNVNEAPIVGTPAEIEQSRRQHNER